jgi:hypothetical protein
LRGGDASVVTVKASYKEDIVRFRVPSSAGVTTVKGEVAMRLALAPGEFDVDVERVGLTLLGDGERTNSD